jgi:general secretion pathway protein E
VNATATTAAPLLGPEAVARARREALATQQPLLACLQAASGLEADAFTAALAGLMGYAAAPMPLLLGLRPRFDLFGFAECSQHRVLVAEPVAEPEGSPGAAPHPAAPALVLVLADPFDTTAEASARARLAAQGLRPQRALLAHPEDLLACLQRAEQPLRALDDVAADAGPGVDEDGTPVISLSSIGEDGSAVVRLVHSTIYDALKIGASDIHLECDAGCLRVQYRVDGVLTLMATVPGQAMAEQVISRVKVMAELDIAERRVPQDGRFKVRVGTRTVDFRVSVMPNMFGEDAVLRLLDRQSVTGDATPLTLDALGLDPAVRRQIRRLAERPHGMLLVTGPTGSGKTTTLYAAVSEIQTGRDKIVTIEDPVEYRLPGVLQIPVNEKKGLSFARGLRSILRHDPDKIMVGEIRDSETAQIAVQAALTGHLVFTTVHANSVFDVLGRFLHMGVDGYSVASALNGVVAQRLLRLNCRHCLQPVVADDDDLAALGLDAAQVQGWRLQAGAGCRHCRGTGYRGRKAVAEVLVLDDALRDLIAQRASTTALKDAARAMGVVPVLGAALACAAAGETTLAEVRRVVG